MTISDQIKRCAELIQTADSLLITAGAGIGMDSGLPDFRGKNGFWRAYPMFEKRNITFEALATPRLFIENPRLAWGFYGMRLKQYRETTPHQGFQILKKWADKLPLGAYIFTSNVDEQFQKAGFPPNRVQECHGSIHMMQCLKKCRDDIWLATEFLPEIDEETGLLTNELPTCPHCQGLARPWILMFDDYDWISKPCDWQNMYFHEFWLPKPQKLVVIEIGAGTAIPTVRNFSNRIASLKNAPLIRINPDFPNVFQAQHIGLKMGALEALRMIDETIGKL